MGNPYRPTSQPGQYGAPYRQDPERTGFLPYPENGLGAQECGARMGHPVEGSGSRGLWFVGFVLGVLGLRLPLGRGGRDRVRPPAPFYR